LSVIFLTFIAVVTSGFFKFVFSQSLRGDNGDDKWPQSFSQRFHDVNLVT